MSEEDRRILAEATRIAREYHERTGEGMNILESIKQAEEKLRHGR